MKDLSDEHGVLNGKGKITYSDGRVEEGIFENENLIQPKIDEYGVDDKLNGQGAITHSDRQEEGMQAEERIFEDDSIIQSHDAYGVLKSHLLLFQPREGKAKFRKSRGVTLFSSIMKPCLVPCSSI